MNFVAMESAMKRAENISFSFVKRYIEINKKKAIKISFVPYKTIKTQKRGLNNRMKGNV